MEEKLERLLDKAEIVDIVQTERAARDQAQWDLMLRMYHDDAVVSLSWFTGSGPEFVAASRRMLESGGHSAHQMGPTLVTQNGSRALAQTTCAVSIRTRLRSVEVEVTAHSRLHQRLEKRGGQWRISRLSIVYLRDMLSLVNPADSVEIDAARLARHRPSYRFLAYLLEENGEQPSADLAGSDRPETVRPLLDADDAWLAAAA
ncbi:nuclear transport factor 2 family protein [Cupriavidus sp. 30B13]|uniref:nuclear transport factor 2 family protein n=1 Tax=Cupriavidus sp. 30B13 TaxID=3384241 RepID=UPI003B8FDEEB